MLARRLGFSGLGSAPPNRGVSTFLDKSGGSDAAVPRESEVSFRGGGGPAFLDGEMLLDCEAVKPVPVSVNGPGDETRWLCRPCATAYEMGVQHGTFCPLPGVATEARPGASG